MPELPHCQSDFLFNFFASLLGCSISDMKFSFTSFLYRWDNLKSIEQLNMQHSGGYVGCMHKAQPALEVVHAPFRLRAPGVNRVNNLPFSSVGVYHAASQYTCCSHSSDTTEPLLLF